MTPNEFAGALTHRASLAGLVVPDIVVARLEAYFRLLATWNKKINLTALPLDSPTDETFDRLFVEPLIAAARVPTIARKMLDVGSGGGSPAIPLAIASPDLQLLMVESRSRKAVFLSEASRAVGLSNARVASRRLEELAADPAMQAGFDLVTMRAVRLDENLESAVEALLRPGGTLMVFGGPAPTHSAFRGAQTLPLLDSELILATKR